MLIGGKSMKVLVTGVNGQLGYDVMNELNQRGHEAIGSDITGQARKSAQTISCDTHNDRESVCHIGSRHYYSGCQTMYSRRSIISVTILTHPNPDFTGNRNIHFSPGTFIGNRNAYIPGCSKHRHYGTFEPDPDNFTQSRQRTPATHKTDI